MGIGVGIFLLAVGAILAFAVNASVEGLDLEAVGWILMAVGAAGILFGLAAWNAWGFGGRSIEHRRTVVDDDLDRPVGGVRRRRVVRRTDDIDLLP